MWLLWNLNPALSPSRDQDFRPMFPILGQALDLHGLCLLASAFYKRGPYVWMNQKSSVRPGV